jgi:hypothetical protein
VGPEPLIAALMGIGGITKLAGAEFAKQNFRRWGYADWWRPAIGVVEVVTAGAAVAGLRYKYARHIAAIGTLSTMGGAIATHALSDDAAYNYVFPVLLAGLAVASLLDVNVTRPIDTERRPPFARAVAAG